jgi:hypothetical protein
LREAARSIACAQAVEQRAGGEPATLAEALSAPHARHWGEAIETVRCIAADTPDAEALASAQETLGRRVQA